MTTSTIVKADGTVEPFDPVKLIGSLTKAGATTQSAERIAHLILKNSASTITTGEVYKKAFSMLRREAKPAAARYNLRRALLELGPSGHPFEDFVAEVFTAEGWVVEWRKVIEGKCVPHEVDLYATRGDEVIAGELKYHNDAFYKTDVKVALYVKARIDDIANCDAKKRNCAITRGMLITNTKFTRHAVSYGACAGLELIGWNYPTEGNLFDRIVASGIYPVTTLTTLRRAEKKLLIGQGIVTSRALKDRREAMRAIGIPPARIGGILAEIESLHNPVLHAGTTAQPAAREPA